MRLIGSWWKNPRTRYGSLIAVLIAVLLLPTHSISDMAVAAVRNAAGMLDARSPGGRDGGILVQTKIPRHAPAARAPHSRVLSETRTRPPGAIGGGPVTPDAPFGGTPLGGFGPDYGPDIFDDGQGPGHFGDLPTGGGPLLLYNSPPEDTPGVTPAVPEPGTYALLILGLGVIGAALRRRPRTVPATGRDMADGAARTIDA